MNRLRISFSGGRSSAVMLDRCLAEPNDDREVAILFMNTGKEESATLDFVDAVDRNFCRPRGHRVTWLEAVTNAPGKGPSAQEVTFETANRTGAPFESAIAKHGIFNKAFPNCTGRLKTEPMEWWTRHLIGWEPGTYQTAIGIRADEMDRVSSKKAENHLIYPLADAGWRKADVSRYMARFDWDLKLPGDHWGNCDACWKKSLRKLMTRAKENPAVFEWWAEMESKHGSVHKGKLPQTAPRVFFRENRSAGDIVAAAQATNFVPYADAVHHPELFDNLLDAGQGCGESCEIGADE